jgi:PRTRC genetic system protein C
MIMGIRKFVVNGSVYPDPDPSLSPDEVRQNLSSLLPELANADTHQAKDGDDTIFTFEKRVGVKG